MGKLLDINHKKVQELIRIAEYVFLEDQMGPRLMKMSSIDKKLAEHEDRTR